MEVIFVTILFFLIGAALIIKGAFRIYGKMIPYSIEVLVKGDKLYNWLKINGTINIGWGCLLLLLSIATLGIGNGYILIPVLIILFLVNVVTTYWSYRKYIS
jgi:hypothetical protein